MDTDIFINSIKKDLLLFDVKEISFYKLCCFSYNSISIPLNDIRHFHGSHACSRRSVLRGVLLHDGCTGYPDYMQDFLL